jgi:hypothetical protein
MRYKQPVSIQLLNQSDGTIINTSVNDKSYDSAQRRSRLDDETGFEEQIVPPNQTEFYYSKNLYEEVLFDNLIIYYKEVISNLKIAKQLVFQIHKQHQNCEVSSVVCERCLNYYKSVKDQKQSIEKQIDFYYNGIFKQKINNYDISYF